MPYLHELTFGQVLASKEAVYDLTGKLVAGSDRRNDLREPAAQKALFLKWQKDVQKAGQDPDTVHPDVMKDFQKAKFYVDPKEHLPKDTPRFSWSFSALNDFETCPFQYAAKRFYKTLPHEETEATLWGTRVHEYAENVLKGNTLAFDETISKLVGPYCDLILNAGGELLVEKQLAVGEDWKPCGWEDGWGRGIIDAVVIKEGKARIFDWKTGKVKDDTLQLKIFCLFLALHRPDIKEFDAKFIWLKHGTVTGLAKPLTRSELMPVIKDLKAKIARIQEAWASENFRMKQGGLCRKWCGAKECPHAGA